MAKVLFQGNVRSAPEWAGDFGGREHIMPYPALIDPAQFQDAAGVQVTVDVAGAAANATSIPLSAPLSPSLFASTILIAQGNVVIPNGTVLYFGASKKFAKLTADAVYGDTTLTVQALPTALVAGDTAVWSQYGQLQIPSGTLIGRTLAERDANTPFGPADTVTPDDEIFLTYFDIPDARLVADVELYRPGSLVKENYLPGISNYSGGALTKLRSIYKCIKGVD